jgi:hypothetical protein
MISQQATSLKSNMAPATLKSLLTRAWSATKASAHSSSNELSATGQQFPNPKPWAVATMFDIERKT